MKILGSSGGTIRKGAITMMKNEDIKKVINGLNFLKEKLYNGIYADRLDCIDYAISALKEVQQYREIGRVQECQKAWESGYDEGYDDGYHDGYALGITQPI